MGGCVYVSEGGTLVGGHAFNDEKAMQTGSLLNTLWDGGAIRRIRVLTGNAFLPGRRCSLHVHDAARGGGQAAWRRCA